MTKYYVDPENKSVLMFNGKDGHIIIRRENNITEFSGTNTQDIFDDIIKRHPELKEIDKVEYEYYLVKFNIEEPSKDIEYGKDVRDEFTVNMDNIEREFNCPCDMDECICDDEDDDDVHCFYDEESGTYYHVERMEDGNYDINTYNINDKTTSSTIASHFFIKGNEIPESEFFKGLNQKKPLPTSKYYYYRNAAIDTDYVYCVIYRPNGDINSIISMAVNKQRLQITLNADTDDCKRWFDRYSKDWQNLSCEMFKECYQHAYRALQKFSNFLDNE